MCNAEDTASPGIDPSSDVTVFAEVSQNRTLPNATETIFEKIKLNFSFFPNIFLRFYIFTAVELYIL